LKRGMTRSGAKIVEAESLDQMYEPYIESDPDRGEAYGLGWFVLRNQSSRFVHHGGNGLGYTAFVSLMPDDGVGVVALTNQHGSDLPQLVARDLYQQLLPRTADAFSLSERVTRLEAIELLPEARAEPGSVAPH